MSAQPASVGTTNPCSSLSDEQLLEEYNSPGKFLNISNFPPSLEFPDHFLRLPWVAEYGVFQETRRELVRRGSNVVPGLIVILEAEVQRSRQAPSPPGSGIGNNYAKDVTRLVSEFRDQRIALSLLRVIDGLDGKATPEARHYAHSGLESLTYISQFKQQPHEGNYSDTIARRGADSFRDYQNPKYAEEATFYTDWLRGEGIKPGLWLELARNRARELIEGDDLTAVYCAVSFLQRPVISSGLNSLRDDMPAKTVARLAEILGKAEKRGVEHEYQGIKSYAYFYKGQQLPVSSGNWKQLFGGLGRYARPHVQVLIHLESDADLDDWGGYRCLSGIGGKDVVGFFIEQMPAFEKELTSRGLEIHPVRESKLGLETFPGDEKVKAIMLADRICRFGVDRWAGRAFTNNSERLLWWETNRNKTEETWLREGVEGLAVAADSGDAKARFILGEILPDLPSDLRRSDWHPYMWFGPKSEVVEPVASSSCLRWLQENGRRLRYDAESPSLRLR